jgi:hypothetical protein
VNTFFFSNLWPGLVTWSVLYISDYTLTMTCARLYHAGVSEKFGFDGSYELNPYFKKDIDSLKLVSPRFLTMLVMMNILLTAIWLLAAQSFAAVELYSFALGVMILVQLAIHTRHLRNLILFRAATTTTDAVRGRIEYSRALVLRMSATELLTFAGLFFVLYLITPNWFVLGGAVGCLVTAVQHLRLKG